METVFICSPYSGDVKKNLENAKKYARNAARRGYAVVCPHLLYPQFLDDGDEREREIGIKSGIEFLGMCDEMWVFASDYEHCTKGMKMEIDACKRDKFIKIKYIDPSHVTVLD